MNLNTLANHLTDIAKAGHIALHEINSMADVLEAQRWSAHFRETIRGIDADLVMSAISKAKAKGTRTFRRGVGLWLTEAEYRRGA